MLSIAGKVLARVLLNGLIVSYPVFYFVSFSTLSAAWRTTFLYIYTLLRLTVFEIFTLWQQLLFASTKLLTF